LERTLYERAINNATLGRARTVGTPRKWNYYNPQRYMEYQTANHQESALVYRLIAPLLELWNRKFVWQWQRDIALQRGYTMDDFYVYTERELRRSPFLEHVWRESTHPYQWLMYKARRRRYYKVERIIQGFFVPDHVRQDVQNHTMIDTLRAVEDWNNFMYQNYYSDMSPTSAHGRGGKLNPLELFLLFGFWKPEAWQRYFFNEETYDLPSNMEEFHAATANPFNVDLETEEGKREFEAKVNKLVADYPGYYVPEGESFNFATFYAKRALKEGGDLSRFDAETLEQARVDLDDQISAQQSLSLSSGEDGETMVGTSSLGMETSELIEPEQRRAFMN